MIEPPNIEADNEQDLLMRQRGAVRLQLDLQNAAEKLAMWDDLVEAADSLFSALGDLGITKQYRDIEKVRIAARIITRARELQK